METETGLLHKIICAYKNVETLFERMANMSLNLFGNSIVFIGAVILVIVWFAVHDWEETTPTEGIYHVIIAISFLSFFIIQRTFTHFAQAIHLKLNELVAATENAHNHVIKAEQISSAEMKEMSKAHNQLIEEVAGTPPTKIITI